LLQTLGVLNTAISWQAGETRLEEKPTR
jgi:hypothetical protein